MATCYRHPNRETGLSCSECGRPICTDCVTFAPVGLRCPDHAGKTARATPRAVRTVRRPLARRGVVVRGDAIVTKILVALNIAVYLITVAQGSGLNNPGGTLFYKWALIGCGRAFPGGACLVGVANGDWWRLITSAFLHGSVIHIAFNMFALWWLGGPVETVLGRTRYIGLYIVSGLAGGAGALVASPYVFTVGASGAIFGLLGAGLILEWQATGSLAGNYLTLILINLVLSFAIPGISIGGHIGGLIGGILVTLAFARFGRVHAAYGRIGLLGAASLLALAALSFLIAYWKVRGLA